MRQTRGARRAVRAELAKPEMSERDTASTHCHTEAVTHTSATVHDHMNLQSPQSLLRFEIRYPIIK